MVLPRTYTSAIQFGKTSFGATARIIKIECEPLSVNFNKYNAYYFLLHTLCFRKAKWALAKK